MNLFDRLKAGRGFSSRSGASYRAQRELSTKLKTCNDQIAQCERRVRETEAEIGQMTANVSRGQYVHPERITEANAYLEGQKKLLAELSKRSTDIEREIAALTPRGSQKAKRIKWQTAFCRLAGKRFETDLEIAGLAMKLRALLLDRQKLSAGMHAAAAVFDLDVQHSPDALDEDRFKALLKLLPPDMERISREWAARFAGDGQTYVVVQDTLEVQETLVSEGTFRRGDRVRLTDAQAAPLQGRIAIANPKNKAA